MKTKRIFAALICVIIIWGMAGCNAPKRQRVNPVCADAQTTIEFLIDAVERKDAQAIKDMFSPYAKDNIKHFDEKIERFVDEFPGWDEDYELKDTFQRWSNHGKITNILTPSYDWVVDDKIYRMRIIYYKESDEDESKLGWYSLQIWERYNDSYTSGAYMHGVEDEPDILLWNYLKDETDRSK
ncbi:MAG: DUF5104 domain-containing protein [Clostridium sp.]|nr:DUF5104 domain-containing protein [Acetatifactor muris]MCM1528316.1 DUF5104 domain-containing protein [Bacteroides sp.]MCM1563017.1 DUF5104 domain-containing protein [Clostridium sp.]